MHKRHKSPEEVQLLDGDFDMFRGEKNPESFGGA